MSSPMGLLRDKLSVAVHPTTAAHPNRPIMRRDTNNLLVPLNRNEALKLVAALTSAFEGGYADVLLHVEFDGDDEGFRPQDHFE